MFSIRQFMWGFQHHFRISLDVLANFCFNSIGADLAPVSLLIGFREEGDTSYPICVEPEDVTFEPGEFDQTMAAADAYFESDESRRILHTDRSVHESYQRGLLETWRRFALAEALNARGDDLGRFFFVGGPARVENYRVYPVVSVARGRWFSLPALQASQSESRVSIRQSLQHAVVHQLLSEATDAMSARVAPAEVGRTAELGQDIIRHAVSDFVRRLSFVHGDWEGTELADSMNAVAAQPYEGRTGVGTILLAKQTHPHVETVVRFGRPVPLRDTRAFRKALEMTGSDVSLLIDGTVAYGLGRARSDYSAADENRFAIQVVGRGSWELLHEEARLVRVDNGVATLPKARISRDVFIDTVTRLFTHSAPEALWQLALQAAEQQHGTMLVVHEAAETEARRLSPQALSIEPQLLSAELLAAVTSIDGAVLVDPEGNCHAVGVILDGKQVEGKGDSARGARFNSAVRYYHGEHDAACVIVIVSEDGMIDLLPSLRKRVRRAAVEMVVQDLENVATSHPMNFERAADATRDVESFAFYLTAEQCDRANSARESIEAERERLALASGGGVITRLLYKPFRPDPEMNESYYID